MDGDAPLSVPDDHVQPFQLENGAARGRLVRLGPAVETVIRGHGYPEPVAALLTQALALAALVRSRISWAADTWRLRSIRAGIPTAIRESSTLPGRRLPIAPTTIFVSPTSSKAW